jgi:polyhydroxyalkanoate synthase subunit PhaC
MHPVQLSTDFAGVFLSALERYEAALAKPDAASQLARLAETQRRYAARMEVLWRNTASRQTGGSPDAAPVVASDPRFRSPEWQSEPYFDALKQAYLIGSSFLHELVDTVGADGKERRQLDFLTRQYTDAMSPANFLATNPEALKLVRNTNGECLVAGLKNLLADLARGRIATTDTNAFEVGRNLACTPGAVVFENELIQLIQYAPSTETVDEQPLVIIPPCINRFYILDLQAETSFVRHAVAQGHTVFIVSWRSATREIEHLTWDDYLKLGVLKAVEVAREITDAAKVHALGFCIGGTLLGCAAAVARGGGQDPFATLTFLTTMLDFADTGDIGLLVDPRLVAMREATIGRGGLLYGAELASVFSMLRANDLVWPYVINNYLKGGNPAAFDILFWNSDSTNLPGPMACWYLRNAYLENRIKIPGGTVQCGTPVDLSTVDMPVYLLATREDHIVPWQTAFASTRLLGGEVRFVLGASGHIAGVINPATRNKRSYWVDGEPWIGPRTWLRTAREVPGSWWTDWSRWLQRFRTQPVPARADLGSSGFPPIEPAPGRYVTTKAEPPGVPRIA